MYDMNEGLGAAMAQSYVERRIATLERQLVEAKKSMAEASALIEALSSKVGELERRS